MSVIRLDLNKCIGCKNCVDICPMDVFYFSEETHKSVLAYPENCQSCGQCYVNCKGHSLAISNETFGYPIMPLRVNVNAPMTHFVMTDMGALNELTRGKIG